MNSAKLCDLSNCHRCSTLSDGLVAAGAANEISWAI